MPRVALTMFMNVIRPVRVIMQRRCRLVVHDLQAAVRHPARREDAFGE